MNTGTPQTLKQVNLSAVRKAIIDKGSATRAEIAALTGISVTTVRALLIEMFENGEIIEVGQDESSGGRKAVRYQMSKEKYYGASICIASDEVRWFVVDICGDVCEQGNLEKDEYEKTTFYARGITQVLDELILRYNIKSIGLGVPGIPDGLDFWRADENRQLQRHSIGRMIYNRYKTPVVLQSDMNALAFGFARCYLIESPNEACESIHMAYIYFEDTCPSAGFISAGRPISGFSNYSGELCMFPIAGGINLSDVIYTTLPDEKYAEIVAKVVTGICCILNPQYVVMGGAAFKRDCLALIDECLTAILPHQMQPQLMHADNFWHDYATGMAALTAEKIFDDVQFVSN